MTYARSVWHRLEALHAVVYFAPSVREALQGVGLRGFWMGYFGARAAPLGAVGPAVVGATFFNFHPDRVARAVPDAWSFAAPEAILRVRCTAAAAVLRELRPAIHDEAGPLLPLLDAVVAAASPDGRPLFAANRALPPPEDPVERLWQHATTLREHRGDGHVACLVAEGIDGCEAHVLFAGVGAVPAETLRTARGWSEAEWAAAADRLARRGLIDGDGLTDAGRQLRQHVEDRTDMLAGAPFGALVESGRDLLLTGLEPLSAAVVDAELLPFPNPIGLPRPGD